MKFKIILSILTVLICLTLSLFVLSSAYAASKNICPRDTIHPCKEDVELLVLQTFQPFIDVVGKLAGQIGDHERRLEKLEAKVVELEARLTLTPSPTNSPAGGTITPTVSPTPVNERL
jgi:hypothetical protein